MARALASKGRQTLETLVINTKLPQNDVKLALLTLLFHRYVLQREHGEKKGRKQVAVEYEFVSSMVLQRLHYPMYIHMVRNTFGEIESLIFEKLLWNGRRRGSDLVLDVEGILFPEVDDEIERVSDDDDDGVKTGKGGPRAKATALQQQIDAKKRVGSWRQTQWWSCIR